MASRGVLKHAHIGFTVIFPTFVGVLILGTIFKLASAHMVASGRPMFVSFGKAMSLQY